MIHGLSLMFSCEPGAGPYAVKVILVFTALHRMQTRSSDENSVRPSVYQTRVISLQRGPVDPKFQLEGVPPATILLRKLG